MNGLNEQKASLRISDDPNQKGTAIVIALFVLALVGVFVALALSRTSAEATAVGNETAEGRAVYAAQGSLETMTRNFNKIFEIKLNPVGTDITAVEAAPVVGLSTSVGGQYNFFQEVLQTSDSTPVVLTDKQFAGLYAIRDYWRLRTTSTGPDGEQVQLTRNILNNRIPIFQFGIFYNDDLELYRPPKFSFGGRVHTNGNFFVSSGTEGIYFDSKVTAVGHIVNQSWRNGFTGDHASDGSGPNANIFIKNALRQDIQLNPNEGSVHNTTQGNSNNVFEFPPANPVPTPTPNPDLPPSRLNPNWASQSAVFDGNLQSRTPRLSLPLNVGANTDLIEMVKRGKEIASVTGGDLFRDNAGNLNPVTIANVDNSILRAERFANKTGIRVSLADSKAKLPGCASGVGNTAIAGICGIRLDGHAVPGAAGAEPDPVPIPPALPTALSARGYEPLQMTDGYRATRVNGDRLYTGGGPREVWIKIESVRTDPANGNIITVDITEDILSLGLTEQAVPTGSGATSFRINSGYNNTLTNNSQITSTNPQPAPVGTDSRSIIKLQRFTIPGAAIPGTNMSLTPVPNVSAVYNAVVRYSTVDAADVAAGCMGTATCTVGANDDNGADASPNEHYGHLKWATIGNAGDKAIVPFPIKMFDMREGFYYDSRTTAYYANLDRVTRNGVMSLVDIDIANLRRFLRGDFNGLFPNTTTFALANGGNALRSTNIPERGGWVLYVSDRRGDANFDGEFDMEDVYGNAPGNDGTMQAGEDLDGPVGPGQRFGAGVLDAAYGTEAERYANNTNTPDRFAVNDHRYYRRGVRLINGETIPGIYDSVTPGNTRGFTVASENGIYVKGNYNATGIDSLPPNANTPFRNYLPFDTPTHIPASIVADSVTILSNAWDDAKSFWSPVTSPYNQSTRVASETYIRFAMISGDTIASRETTPNQGGISPKLNGGVHNFKRFLEQWTGTRLNYAGSLINLYTSRNNNGSFKCCNTVYNPPRRNWTFDGTFLDPARLPPGTPFFQYIQTTGFQRTNN